MSLRNTERWERIVERLQDMSDEELFQEFFKKAIVHEETKDEIRQSMTELLADSEYWSDDDASTQEDR